MIIRSQKTKEEYRYTRVDNESVTDSRLSFAARGLLAYLLSKPDNWRVVLAHLATQSPAARFALRGMLNELMEFGYARHVQSADPATGRFGAHDYEIFECCRDGLAAGGSTGGGFTASGKLDASIDLKGSKTGSEENGEVANATSPRRADARRELVAVSEASASIRCSVAERESEPDVYEGTIANLRDEDFGPPKAKVATSTSTKGGSTAPKRKDGGGGAEPPVLTLNGEGPEKKGEVPWRMFAGLFKRVVPEITMPGGAERRDHTIRAFWAKNGKSMGVLEMLAQKLAASDYLMARGRFAVEHGVKRSHVSWGWVFEKHKDGKLKAQKILDGDYDNERMNAVWDRNERFAAERAQRERKKTKCMDLNNKIVWVYLDEQWNGAPRYSQYGEHANGLPLICDDKALAEGPVRQ